MTRRTLMRLPRSEGWPNFIPQYVPTAVVAAVLAGD